VRLVHGQPVTYSEWGLHRRYLPFSNSALPTRVLRRLTITRSGLRSQAATMATVARPVPVYSCSRFYRSATLSTPFAVVLDG